MITVTIFYPAEPGRRFDHDYYVGTHIPMALALLGPSVRSVSVDRGVSPGGMWPASTYFAICRFQCDTLEAYEQAAALHGGALQADVANYSDVAPIIQIGEVLLDEAGHAPA